jgi:hypothetical protein
MSIDENKKIWENSSFCVILGKKVQDQVVPVGGRWLEVLLLERGWDGGLSVGSVRGIGCVDGVGGVMMKLMRNRIPLS